MSQNITDLVMKTFFLFCQLTAVLATIPSLNHGKGEIVSDLPKRLKDTREKILVTKLKLNAVQEKLNRKFERIPIEDIGRIFDSASNKVSALQDMRMVSVSTGKAPLSNADFNKHMSKLVLDFSIARNLHTTTFAHSVTKLRSQHRIGVFSILQDEKQLIESEKNLMKELGNDFKELRRIKSSLPKDAIDADHITRIKIINDLKIVIGDLRILEKYASDGKIKSTHINKSPVIAIKEAREEVEKLVKDYEYYNEKEVAEEKGFEKPVSLPTIVAVTSPGIIEVPGIANTEAEIEKKLFAAEGELQHLKEQLYDNWGKRAIHYKPTEREVIRQEICQLKGKVELHLNSAKSPQEKTKLQQAHDELDAADKEFGKATGSSNSVPPISPMEPKGAILHELIKKGKEISNAYHLKENEVNELRKSLKRIELVTHHESPYKKLWKSALLRLEAAKKYIGEIEKAVGGVQAVVELKESIDKVEAEIAKKGLEDMQKSTGNTPTAPIHSSSSNHSPTKTTNSLPENLNVPQKKQVVHETIVVSAPVRLVHPAPRIIKVINVPKPLTTLAKLAHTKGKVKPTVVIIAPPTPATHTAGTVNKATSPPPPPPPPPSPPHFTVKRINVVPKSPVAHVGNVAPQYVVVNTATANVLPHSPPPVPPQSLEVASQDKLEQIKIVHEQKAEELQDKIDNQVLADGHLPEIKRIEQAIKSAILADQRLKHLASTKSSNIDMNKLLRYQARLAEAIRLLKEHLAKLKPQERLLPKPNHKEHLVHEQKIASLEQEKFAELSKEHLAEQKIIELEEKIDSKIPKNAAEAVETIYKLSKSLKCLSKGLSKQIERNQAENILANVEDAAKILKKCDPVTPSERLEQQEAIRQKIALDKAEAIIKKCKVSKSQAFGVEEKMNHDAQVALALLDNFIKEKKLGNKPVSEDLVKAKTDTEKTIEGLKKLVIPPKSLQDGHVIIRDCDEIVKDLEENRNKLSETFSKEPSHKSAFQQLQAVETLIKDATKHVKNVESIKSTPVEKLREGQIVDQLETVGKEVASITRNMVEDKVGPRVTQLSPKVINVPQSKLQEAYDHEVAKLQNMISEYRRQKKEFCNSIKALSIGCHKLPGQHKRPTTKLLAALQQDIKVQPNHSGIAQKVQLVKELGKLQADFGKHLNADAEKDTTINPNSESIIHKYNATLTNLKNNIKAQKRIVDELGSKLNLPVKDQYQRAELKQLVERIETVYKDHKLASPIWDAVDEIKAQANKVSQSTL